MKTSPMLIVSLGVLLCSTALAQYHSPSADWQPMKINQTIEPTFPRHLVNSGVTAGVCQVAIYVDTTGKLGEWLVVKYTHQEFADAVVAAIKQWTFEPARMNGEAVGTTLDLVFNFEARGVVVSTTTMGEAAELLTMHMRSGEIRYRPCSSEDLDRVPVPTVMVTPLYPKVLAEKGVKGRVTVEYYIDETGAVRMPCVSPDDNPYLGALTIAAVRQWKFAPPTSRGRSVLVKARQEFNFQGDQS